MDAESGPYELCAYPNPYCYPYNIVSSSSSSRIASFWQQVCRSARSWKKSVRKRWLDVRHSKRQQRRLLKHMEIFYAVVLLLVLLLFLYYMFWGETEADQALLFRFVSIRESRMDIHLRSEELTCEHITGHAKPLPGFEAQLLFTETMKTAGVRLLKQRPSMACNCAPLYNFPFRYITLPSSKEVAHLFNPVVTGSLPELGKSLVTESQELLIPGAGTRNMTRLNGIQLSFHDEWCQLKQLSFTYSTAWCIQSCIDLLNGKTIYEN